MLLIVISFLLQCFTDMIIAFISKMLLLLRPRSPYLIFKWIYKKICFRVKPLYLGWRWENPWTWTRCCLQRFPSRCTSRPGCLDCWRPRLSAGPGSSVLQTHMRTTNHKQKKNTQGLGSHSSFFFREWEVRSHEH